jgi:hypothetical protein
MMAPQFHIQSDLLDCSFSSTTAGMKVYFSESMVTFEKNDFMKCFLFKVFNDEAQSKDSQSHPIVNFLHD